jgi:hypothetical protein
VFKKKPWSDALFPDFDDSFESRFYCFGGDGGGNKGGGGTPPPKENVYNPEDQEPERGRPTTTAPPPQKAEVYTGPFTSQIAEDIYKSGPERPPTDVQKGFGIADIAPQAVVGVGDVIDKKRLDNKTLASFSPNMPEDNRMSDGLQKGLSSVYNQNLYNPEPSTLNLQNVYEEAVSPKELGVDFLGGTLSPDFNLKDDKYGFKYVRRFNQGGIVSLLQPLGDYLGNQIDQQRVDPFLEMVENAAYQEFGIDPSSGGGGMGSVGFDLPGETFGPGQMEPQVGGFLGRPALGLYATATTGQEQMTDLLGVGPNIGNETVQPNFMQSALGYFGETYDTFNADTGMSSTAMTPELMVQQAQSRLMQQDLKPKAETDYLNNIIQTGGNPTMMAPDMSGNMQQLNLLEVGPGGGVSSGQALPSTNPYQAQLQSAFGGIGSLF